MPQVRVILRGRKKPVAKTVKSRSAVVEEILLEMCLNPQEFLIRLNGQFVPDNQRIRTGDKLELMEITSRG